MSLRKAGLWRVTDRNEDRQPCLRAGGDPGIEKGGQRLTDRKAKKIERSKQSPKEEIHRDRTESISACWVPGTCQPH